MAQSPTSYPPTLSQEQLSNLIFNIKDYQVTHGMLLKYGPDASSIYAVPVRVSLFPSLFPESLFEEAKELQVLYNRLYARVAEDEEWLLEVLEGLIRDDEFAGTLWRIYQEVKREGYVQDVTLGLFRSDYMVHISKEAHSSRPTIALKQVEFNTYSIAGGAHANNAGRMHKHLDTVSATCLPYGDGPDNASVSQSPTTTSLAAAASTPLDLSLDAGRPIRPPLVPSSSATSASPLNSQRSPSQRNSLPSLPSNETITSLVSGLIAAHETYGSPKSHAATRTGILFIVQPQNMNICDERPLEYALWKQIPAIPAYRVIFGEEVLARTTLSDSRELLYHPMSPSDTSPIEISVIYLRAGYDPEEYSPTGCDARLHLEMSRAIKCPTILSHLSTFKKVQQALASPGVLARFLDPVEAERIERTFAPMFPLDGLSEAGKYGRAFACNPKTAVNYVLKPSLEGGGHNVYRDDIPKFLEEVPEEKLHTYVLMELINPVLQKNILLSPRGLYTAADADVDTDSTSSSEEKRNPHTAGSEAQLPGPAISELGIFGVCLWRSNLKTDSKDKQNPELLTNRQGGWSLKTKPIGVDEMSVVKGYGCFDCPYLVDEATYLANGTYSYTT